MSARALVQAGRCTHLRNCDAMSLEVMDSPPQGVQVSGLLQKAHLMAQPCKTWHSSAPCQTTQEWMGPSRNGVSP